MAACRILTASTTGSASTTAAKALTCISCLKPSAPLASSIPQYAGLSNAQVVGRMYENVLGRTGDAEGVAYWTNFLNNGGTIAQLIVGVLAVARIRCVGKPYVNGFLLSAANGEALYTGSLFDVLTTVYDLTVQADHIQGTGNDEIFSAPLELASTAASSPRRCRASTNWTVVLAATSSGPILTASRASTATTIRASATSKCSSSPRGNGSSLDMRNAGVKSSGTSIQVRSGRFRDPGCGCDRHGQCRR